MNRKSAHTFAVVKKIWSKRKKGYVYVEVSYQVKEDRGCRVYLLCGTARDEKAA